MLALPKCWTIPELYHLSLPLPPGIMHGEALGIDMCLAPIADYLCNNLNQY